MVDCNIDNKAKQITQLMAKKVAEKIKLTRKEQNITTRKLKELANVSTAIISEFETHNEYLPKMEVLVKFALALNIEIKDLLSCMLPSQDVLDVTNGKADFSLEDVLKAKYAFLTNEDINQILNYIEIKNNQSFIKDFMKNAENNNLAGSTINSDDNGNLIIKKDGKTICIIPNGLYKIGK